MGPRSIERGNRTLRALYRFNNRASIGPRSIVRGNCQLIGEIDLLLAASMGPRSIERGNTGYLRVLPRCTSRFNGAAFDRTRK